MIVLASNPASIYIYMQVAHEMVKLLAPGPGAVGLLLSSAYRSAGTGVYGRRTLPGTYSGVGGAGDSRGDQRVGEGTVSRR